MRLSPARFNRHLAKMGQSFGWRRAFLCPCRDPHTGAIDPDCPTCGGKGYAWADAVSGISGIAGQKIQREWAQLGMWEAGDVVLSIPSNSALYAMGEFDRVLMLDSSQPFSTQSRLGQPLRWPAVSIDRVFYLDEEGVAVDVALPSLSSGGTLLQWLPPDDDPGGATGAPPAAAILSVTGRRRPEYFCWGEFPSDRAHHHGEPLPRRVVLRRFDLYGR